MKINIREQMGAIQGRLRFYAEVIPRRGPHYGNHKKRNIIPRLKRALQKIEEGTYGLCDDCGEPIAEERLKLIPGAIQCVVCRAAEEKQGAKSSR